MYGELYARDSGRTLNDMNFLTTRTGNFPIGYRRGGWQWQSPVEKAIEWSKSVGLGVLDISRDPAEIAPILAAGLRVGSMDLLEWHGLLSPDKAKRADAVAKNAAYVAQCGAQNYFAVMLPEDPTLPRSENFGYMVDGLNALAPALESAGGSLVIEGWPGDGALCCTPESYRATFRECASPTVGVNYDPSHLLRMGIDPIRFLKEFATRVHHVHGKDCEVHTDDLYEYGHEQPPSFKKDYGWGGPTWRYTIPGHGNSNWSEIFRILQENGYKGAVCIELEDKNYNGSEETEKSGLLTGARFLSSC